MYLKLLFIRTSFGIRATLIFTAFSFLMACSTAHVVKEYDIKPIKIVSSTICRDIKESQYISEPILPTRDFSSNDKEVVSYISIAHLSGWHLLRWEWFTPEGRLYQTTGNRVLKTPLGEYAEKGSAYHTIAIKGRNAAAYPGKWQVKIYLDNVLAAAEQFFVYASKEYAPKEEEFFKDIGGIDFGNYYALVIGINNYTQLRKLKSANNDARAVADILEKRYGFTVTLLLDATRADIILALDRIRLKMTEEDNLLIYYAGHGILDKEADEGYWLPVNASKESTLKWISNSNITSKIKAMAAKHVMVVADSCYAGKLVRDIDSPFSRGVGFKKKSFYQSMARKRARTVMCSGGLEPVTDSGGKSGHSVFASAFIDALISNEGIMFGTQLFSRLRRPVVLNSDQTPEYSDIRKAGHDGGDFLFVSQNLVVKD